jgi:uncharacterized membrane protein YhiD involved in acid resistance
MASKTVSSTLAGKIAHRSMAVNKLTEAAPLIAEALVGTAAPEAAEGVISASFDPEDFITP